MKKLYPILYSRDSLENVRIWQMEQDNEKYRTISGIENGQLVTSEWTVALAKNEGKINSKNPVEQAAAEIDYRYKKQLKLNYFLDKKNIDKEQFFQVMLAKSYSDYKKDINWDKGVGVQIKYNGGRIVARKTGLYTRKGEKILSIPHIEEGLKPFFDKYPAAILDGEGFNFNLRERLNEIMSLLRKTVHISVEDINKSKELIRYYIYDGGNIDKVTLNDTYLVRKQAIDIYFKNWYGKDIVHEVPTWIVYSEEELNKLYSKFLEDNHEGAIIRILDQPYQEKRSKFLLKYKPIETDECIIQDIISGSGNWSGSGKIITVKWKDKIFNITLKGTFEQGVQLLKDKDKWIGKEIQFQFNGKTGLGIPNFGQMDYNNNTNEK